jgi:hypothetical protein
VKSLPGKPNRKYIITVFSYLGDRYQDPQRPDTPTGLVRYAQGWRAVHSE